MTEKSLLSFRALSFDVYSTLITRESGIYTPPHLLSSLSRASTQTGTSKHAFLNRYHVLEAKHQAETPTLPYNALPSRVYRDLHEQLCPETPLSTSGAEAFGNSVPTWPAFPDAKAAQEVCVAEEIGSCKPGLENFGYMLGKAAGFGVKREEVLVTAQSLWHDHVPAEKAGLVGAWIDREGGSDGGSRGWKWRFRSLGEMADVVEAEAGSACREGIRRQGMNGE
ncbi:hypothetical protein L873DRAFT_1834719 [Choiromyces venosus 120613-1]|uniref:HAD-like protein n=1 Tax=Choiromyces venosus 120613-1 TaxID=1336337 RepID=A0A3N4JS70_9PEZI|nr:hypothetical protein L873DRAFT_1834719 [Choiromyces venosus 120613-1]